MYTVALDLETDTLQRVIDVSRQWPELVIRDAQKYVVPFMDKQVEGRLRRRIPGPVKKPIQWTSEKQRRAFFATDGFGHGIPYRRTGKLAQAWEVFASVSGNGLALGVRNDAPAAPFVYGAWKQQFHTNTGWPDARPIIDTIAMQAEPVIVDIPFRVSGGLFARRGIGYP